MSTSVKSTETLPAPIKSLPAPWRITFDTNVDDCNLKCIMCEDHSPYSCTQVNRRAAGMPPRRMDIEVIRKVIAECAPLGLREIIPSTMGEPLLYKDFDQIIDLCRDYGIKLNLTTNGTFPRLGPTEWAQLLVPVASDVKISWNGATPKVQELVMLGSRFETQLRNLREYLKVRDELATPENRSTVTLQLTFMEVNLHEIPDVVRLGIREGVDRIKGHHLWAHFDEIKELNLRREKRTVEMWNEVVRECYRIADESRLPDGSKIKLANFFELSPDTRDEIHPAATCPFLGNEAWVNWQGRFDPCCAPDQLGKTLGSFGNVGEDGMLPIWQGSMYQNLVTDYLDNDLCRGCNMRVPPENG